MADSIKVSGSTSYAHGIPLAAETGIGALTLGGYLREVTARFGPREAGVMHLADRVERWSYTQLWERSVEVARALVACGVGKGTRVGVLMTNRLEFLSAVFGTALAGGVATTISTFFTSPELDEVLKASGCSVLLLERNVLKKDFAAMLAGLEPAIASGKPGQLAATRYPFLRFLAAIDDDAGMGVVEGWHSFLGRGAEVAPALVDATAAAVAPSDPGLLFFSSGSTGKAKGILSAHRGVCLQLWRWALWYDIQEPPRTLSANGFFFSGNFSMAFGGTLSTGGSLILQRYFDAEGALALMEKEQATMLLAWPHQWAQFLAAPSYASTNLATMHYIDAESPIAQHPTIHTQWRDPKHAYGSTETFTLITVYPSSVASGVAGNSHGLPTAGSVIKIVDPFTGEPVPLGERGEIAVKGPTLMLGYIGTPLDETLDDEGFFHTNDGGYLDPEGRLFWEGRLNDIIKTGGANVSPLEIDDCIRRCPGVKVNQTVGVPDALLGELVVCCVVPHAGQKLSEEDIRSFARKSLASYKVPRRVLFFAEDELRTTGSAKIKTGDLRKLATNRIEAEKTA
jgi:fatty-acyl-CoA synthase